MKVKHLIKELKKYNPEASVELTKMLAVDRKTMDGYEMRLDFPICGLASAQNGEELLLIVEHDKTLAAFAKDIIPLPKEAIERD